MQTMPAFSASHGGNAHCPDKDRPQQAINWHDISLDEAGEEEEIVPDSNAEGEQHMWGQHRESNSSGAETGTKRPPSPRPQQQVRQMQQAAWPTVTNTNLQKQQAQHPQLQHLQQQQNRTASKSKLPWKPAGEASLDEILSRSWNSQKHTP